MKRKPLYLALGVLLLAALLSGPFIVDFLLVPAATGVWFLLRTFVLSIDQHVIMSVALSALIAIVLFRAIIRIDSSVPVASRRIGNYAMENLIIMRNHFTAEYFNPDDMRKLKKELTNMLVTTYAAGKHLSPDYTILDAFRTGEIPLPDNVHAFLFPRERKIRWYDLGIRLNLGSKRAYRQFLRDFEEILGFLEQYTEIQNEHESYRLHD